LSLAVLLGALHTTAVKVGDWVCVDAGLNLRDKACGNVLFQSTGAERGRAVAVEAAPSCALGNYTWVSFNNGEGGRLVYGAVETNLLQECNPKNVAKMIPGAPYINQRFDVGNEFDGDWACGPTSSLMAVSFYKKVPAKSISCSKPWLHTNEFGWYDSQVFTSPTGFVFNRTQTDAAGHPFAGAWGSCTNGGGAIANLCQSYIQHHGLKAVFFGVFTFANLKAAIDAGHVVVLDTLLSTVGHIVLATGYTTDGNVLLNDPYGNRNQLHWGSEPNGEEVVYTPAALHLGERWALEVMPAAAYEGEPPVAPDWATSGFPVMTSN
jgi:hypothetical protein